MRPGRLLATGLVLVVSGAVLPFLMVIGLLPATLLLSFVAYTSSVAGLFLGLMGAAAMVASRRDGGGRGRL